MALDSDSPLSAKTMNELLKHCLNTFAFVDSVTSDILVRTFIHFEKLAQSSHDLI